MKRYLIILLYCFWGQTAHGQSPDSLQILTYPQFYRILVANHPVVKQADLQIDAAESQLMQAQGLFDPKIAATFDRKSLQDKIYYNRLVSDLKVPVWGGIDAKIGQEQNTGYYLNKEVTEGRLAYAGVSLPLLRNLLLDERRATLQQARTFRQLAEAKQQQLLNKIVFAGTKAYWDCYVAFQEVNYTLEGLTLAERRFQYLRSQVLLGERAGVDSVEAKITLQTRQVDYQNALIAYQTTQLQLANYLWDNNEQPIQPNAVIVPTFGLPLRLTEKNLDELRLAAETNHPDIASLQVKLEQLDIERRFRQGQLLPRLDASLYALHTPKAPFTTYLPFQTNHKIGLDFEFPLFLRKERGKLSEVKIKVLQTEVERRQVAREIQTDIRIAYNEALLYEKLLRIQEEATANQRLLVQAEQQKFELGESSLFLINAREAKLIEMLVKTEELKGKYRKAVAQLAFAAGRSSINLD